jgi:NADP-dependent 3-hydroxy acid dehydrogenase YdfG
LSDADKRLKVAIITGAGQGIGEAIAALSPKARWYGGSTMF